jgi:cAMP-dependent protein kinase regulator
MSQAKPKNAVDTLDEAWSLVAEGRTEDGLRHAIAQLEADALQLGAALLVLSVLAPDGGDVVHEAAARLADAFVRRSDLPAATAAVRMAGPGPAAAQRSVIAKAFGKGSKLLADVAPPPPPLPVAPSTEPALAKLGGAALRERGEKALRKIVAATDPWTGTSKVTALPLFSALPPEPLERLLGALELRALARGQKAIEQGEEGREAFIVVRGTLQAERQGADGASSGVLAILGPGAIFGEMALVSEAPRAASVTATEGSLLLVASRDALEEIARTEPAIGKELASFCRARMMANLLRHSSILGAVAPAQRDDLVARFQTRTFQAGEALTTQGQETDGLYLVASGAVRVTGTDADGDRIVLAELGPGDVVGEISLVLRRPATATVVASHPTVALHLPRERFQEAIREHPTLLSELYELATRREEETRSVVAQQALDVEDVVLV